LDQEKADINNKEIEFNEIINEKKQEIRKKDFEIKEL